MTDLTPVFSDATPATCPECGGPQLVPHPAGLVYRHDTLAGCSLQDAEDARLAADKERPGERPTTPTERILLAAASISVPEDALCLVEWMTPGVRRRTWLVA
jgi:hypothetical protein